MMSIAQVRSAGSAGNYYTDKDNYYVLGSMGERWAGQGAEQLGLQGSVDKDVFTRLLEGRLPDGADLSRMQDGRNRHRPGYDLTFSAPKSVSMMAMLGGDKRLIEAHNQAVDFAVRQVEALASTRVMTDGQSETVLTGNLVMALFNHDTSRDQEPQLHTHAVVANVTQHNGEWKTLSSDKVGNRILHLDQSWMFLVGRGAFPLFALVWGLNLSRHTHIRQEAINRLWGWAVIAQFAYYLAGFPWYEGNILFAFAVAAQVLTWCETRTWWRSAETMLLLAMWLPFSGTSYGIAGLLMLAVSHRLYRAEDRMERLALVACLLAVIPALNLATSDAAAVAGLVMTVLTVGLVSCAGKSLPRFWPGDFFPTFYACHLAVLGVLAL